MLKTYSDEDLAEFMKMAISESSESEYAEAFILFFQRHKQFVRLRCEKFAKKMGLPASMADDMFSDFFSKFCWGPQSSILRFDPSKGSSRTPFLSWALKVLQRVALDMRRCRQSPETLLPQEEWDEIYLPDEEAPSSEPPSTPERKAIEDALNNLSERDRSIVLEYAGRKPVNLSQRNAKGVYDEIGAMFATSGENVKMIYKRFRQAALKNLAP